MNIFSIIGDFLLSEWLWSVTFDWYHVFIACLLCTWLFRLVLRMPWRSAFLYALLSYAYALVVFALVVVGILVYLFDISYPSESIMAPDCFHACFYLGLIFTVLQATFFAIINHWHTFNIRAVLFLIVLSNSVTALATCFLLMDRLM